jgi:hypothetical protein
MPISIYMRQKDTSPGTPLKLTNGKANKSHDLAKSATGRRNFSGPIFIAESPIRRIWGKFLA